MVGERQTLISFLKDLMRRRRKLPSQLAADLGISHSTVSRWLSGRDVPSLKSCQKLAEYSGVSINRILNIAGYLSEVLVAEYVADLPEFREYAQKKYPRELHDDIVLMVEDMIERKRAGNKTSY